MLRSLVGSEMCIRDRKSMLPIVAVHVRTSTHSKPVKTYALLDSGSTHSFCSEALLTKLGASTKSEKIALTTLHQESNQLDTRSATLYVSNTNDTESIVMPMVYARKVLPIKGECIAVKEELEDQYPHLRDLDIPMADTKKVTLLIGQDNPEALIPRGVISGRRREPYAVKTILGWTISGPVCVPSEAGPVVSGFAQVEVVTDNSVQQGPVIRRKRRNKRNRRRKKASRDTPRDDKDRNKSSSTGSYGNKRESTKVNAKQELQASISNRGGTGNRDSPTRKSSTSQNTNSFRPRNIPTTFPCSIPTSSSRFSIGRYTHRQSSFTKGPLPTSSWGTSHLKAQQKARIEERPPSAGLQHKETPSQQQCAVRPPRGPDSNRGFHGDCTGGRRA